MAKGAMAVAGVLAAIGALAFVGGVVLLAAGLLVPSAGEGGGLMSSLGNTISGVLPGGDGPESPGYEDGHPVGLYLMTRYWIATGSLEKAIWYFTSDGRVYYNLEDGFSEEKLNAHQGRQGTVSVDGATMTIRWSDGKESRGSYERETGGFNWDMGIFAPVKGFADETALVGKWEGGSSMSFSGSSSATSTSFDLRADGTFSGYAIASLRSTSDGSTASAGSGGSDSGTWALNGYSLVLTYADGRVVRGVTVPFDDEKTEVYPDRFYFGATMYKKQVNG